MINESLQIKDIKKLVLTSKKESKELSQAYGSIIKQIEVQTVGVANPETDEKKLILSAAKKELKEQEQSKGLNAPYSELTIQICKEFVEVFSPKFLSEDETLEDIKQIVASGADNMGSIMKVIKTNGKLYDMSKVSQLIKTVLS